MIELERERAVLLCIFIITTDYTFVMLKTVKPALMSRARNRK